MRRVGIVVDATLALLALAAVVVAVVAAGRPSATAAQRAQSTRTELSTVAAHELVVMNRIDYTRVDADLSARAAVVTGSLATAVVAQRGALAAEVRAEHTVVTARVLYAALDSVDLTGGTAQVISLLQVTVGRPPRQVVHQERVLAGMQHTPRGWLLDALRVIP